jgi:hypothetical protein
MVTPSSQSAQRGARVAERTNKGKWMSTAQKRLVGFVLVLAVLNMAYRVVYATGWAHTGALYVGIPTLLAVGLACLPRSRSATGMLLRGSTLALLIACVVLPEGLVCLLFVLPLVALIAVAVGAPIDLARKQGREQGPTLRAVALPLFVLSLEGVIGTPFDPHDAATATVIVTASAGEVEAAVASQPNFAPEPPP